MSQEGTFIDMYCKVLLFSIVFVVILKIIVYVKNHDGIVHTDSYESILNVFMFKYRDQCP